MISLSVTEENEKLTDLDVHIKLGNDSQYLIKFYGALNANVNNFFLIVDYSYNIKLLNFCNTKID